MLEMYLHISLIKNISYKQYKLSCQCHKCHTLDSLYENKYSLNKNEIERKIRETCNLKI